MNLEALKSAIYNHVVGGLKGTNQNFSFSMDQLEDEIIEERVALIKEYSIKNLLPRKELLLSIRCIPIDCSDIERCCRPGYDADKIKHFEIPQMMLDFGSDAIEYVGPADGSRNYKVYTGNGWQYHTSRQRGSQKPYVWIDTTPNLNNKYDAFIFNQPLLMETITVTAIFKDPRQLKDYNCCNEQDYLNMSFLERDIKNRLIERYFRYQRQGQPAEMPNDQIIKP